MKGLKTVCLLFLATCFITVPQQAEAQIVKDILRKASRSLENKAEDMIAEALAEAVARQLQKKIDNYFDDLARETYRQDSINRVENGDTLRYKNYQEMMSDMLGNMNDNSAILDEYEFDLTLDVEIASGKEVDDSKFFYTKDKAVFGVEQNDGKEGTSLMLFDLDNNVIVLFNEDKKGKKTAQALPWLLDMGAVVAASDDQGLNPTNIKKTGQQKMIAGYNCDEYTGETEEETFEFYATPDLAEYWENSMGQFMQRFTNYEYNNELQKIDGMVLASVNKKKKAEKKTKKFNLNKKKEGPDPDTDSWTVTKVSKDKFKVTKADYEFVTLGSY
ncbi:MAG: hypothetical protein Sapg2KO_46660 [Saprospiraceae bacterium]